MKHLTFMASRFVLPLPMSLRKLEQTPLNGIAWTRQAPCFWNRSSGVMPSLPPAMISAGWGDGINPVARLKARFFFYLS